MNPNSMDDFISRTAKSSVAVVLPLFGYGADIPNNPLLQDHVLSFVLNRVYSSVHQLYFIFVANPQTTENVPEDPLSVANVLAGKSAGGNTTLLPIEHGATYTQYVSKGVDFALKETKAQFVVVMNPWVMIQEGGLDVLIDRANRAGEAKAISGFDLRSLIAAEQFDTFKDPLLKEQWDLNFNFFCMPRYAAEMVKWEPIYQTHTFMEYDIGQSLKNLGFAAISYPQAGIFPFDFNWSQHETKDQQSADQQTFTQKWGFSVQV